MKEVWRRDGLQAEPGREVKVGKLKSAASKRTVPLNDTAIAMIQDLRKETYFGEDTPLVPGEHGNFTRPVNFRKRYYRILAAAGIEKKGLHSLRHTFATLALQNGVDVKTVSSILRGRRENRLFHSGPLQRWFHLRHLCSRYHHRPAGGGQENGRGAGAEGAMRKIPGAGMWRYPLQSLTQTQGKTVWVRYGSRRKTTPEPRSSGVVLCCPF